MIFEAVILLRLKTKTRGTLELKAGERMEVSASVMAQLQAQLPGKIRVIEDEPSQLRPGVRVEFFSPLFGMCTATIQEVTNDRCTITNHSVLHGEGEPVSIPTSWICGVYRERPASPNG